MLPSTKHRYGRDTERGDQKRNQAAMHVFLGNWSSQIQVTEARTSLNQVGDQSDPRFYGTGLDRTWNVKLLNFLHHSENIHFQ